MDAHGLDEVIHSTRFPEDLMYRGALMYYQEDRTQAEIATQLGISRSSVSRLLADARTCGIVRIQIVDPSANELEHLESQLARVLGLRRVWLTPSLVGAEPGSALAPAVARALEEAALRSKDALLVSSGATMFQISGQQLLRLPGVLVAPNVGGQDEIEAYYQTNEIARRLAVNAGATPVLLHAPVQPGADLYPLLMQEPSIQRVMQVWRRAQCALLGIGLPPKVRTSLPMMLCNAGVALSDAVGDICNRIYDVHGNPIPYPGSDRMFAMELDEMRRIPHAIGVAVGPGKAQGIAVAAQAGFINRLITDVETAMAILALPHHDPVTADAS